MNPVRKIVNFFIDPWVKMGRAAVASGIPAKVYAATLGNSVALLTAGFGFCTRKIPNAMCRLGKAIEQKGDALCYGPRAHRTIMPGIIIRQAGKAVQLGSYAPDVHRIIASGLCTASMFFAAPYLGPLAFFMAVSAYAPVVAAVSVVGTGALLMGGCALAVLPAVCNIPVGRRRRDEAIAEEESAKRRAEREARQKLPLLDRELYMSLSDAEKAPPHERVEWFEALKKSFPEDFAEAARLDESEIAPVLSASLQLKGPLQFKTPKPAKPGIWASLRRRAHL